MSVTPLQILWTPTCSIQEKIKLITIEVYPQIDTTTRKASPPCPAGITGPRGGEPIHAFRTYLYCLLIMCLMLNCFVNGCFCTRTCHFADVKSFSTLVAVTKPHLRPCSSSGSHCFSALMEYNFGDVYRKQMGRIRYRIRLWCDPRSSVSSCCLMSHVPVHESHRIST